MEENDLFKILNSMRDLGYRRFKKLTPEEKRIYTKSNLYPLEKELALKYKKVSGKTIEQSLKWAKRKYNKFIKYLNTIDDCRNYEYNEKYIYKELLFQGFIKESEFKKKRKCNYIISNRQIMGNLLIFPMHGALNHNLIIKGYPNIYTLNDKIGLSGYTKVDIKI